MNADAWNADVWPHDDLFERAARHREAVDEQLGDERPEADEPDESHDD